MRLLETRIDRLEEENRAAKERSRQQSKELEQLQETVTVLVRNIELMRGLLQEGGSGCPTEVEKFRSLPDSPCKFTSSKAFRKIKENTLTAVHKQPPISHDMLKKLEAATH